MKANPTLQEMLAAAPNNWGKWGPDDEIGALNYLDKEQVLMARDLVRDGMVFTLAIESATTAGDPVFPGRWPARRYTVADHAQFEAGLWTPMPGGLKFADDYVTGFAQLGTHCDALGHMWYGDQIWNGFSAETTTGGMGKAGIVPIANHGIVGRAVLVDIARYRNVDHLESGSEITLDELLAAAQAQNTELSPKTILLVRTGWLPHILSGAGRVGKGYWEPGLSYSDRLAWWFHDQQIPCLATDTLANECTYHPATGIQLPLHAALMRNLGVVFCEANNFDALALKCAQDQRWEFMFAASPVPIAGGTGGSLNPIAIK